MRQIILNDLVKLALDRESARRVVDANTLDNPIVPPLGYGWFTPLVREILIYQVQMLGNQPRKYGKGSFITHLIDVAAFIDTVPELDGIGPERRGLTAVAHDLEDIAKQYNLSPDLVLLPVMQLLDGRNEGFQQKVRSDLFMLMDPNGVSGADRLELQMDRARSASELVVQIRRADKMCTYAADLVHMTAIDPRTGLPFLHFETRQDVHRYVATMRSRQAVIYGLHVQPAYKRQWDDLYRAIMQTLRAQYDEIPTGAVRPALPVTMTSPHRLVDKIGLSPA